MCGNYRGSLLIGKESSLSTDASFCDIISHYAITKGGIFMGIQETEKKKKQISLGLLAHV